MRNGCPDHDYLLQQESGLKENVYSASTVTVGKFYATKLLHFRLKGNSVKFPVLLLQAQG